MLKHIANVALLTLYLAVTGAAVVSPANLNSDLSILIHNDLLGTHCLYLIQVWCYLWLTLECRKF